jgi:hypothetical protein
MATSRKHQDRALSADERDLVDKTRHPALQELSDQDLAQLTALVRERRDRAQTEAFRQRREMRGKAEAKGARPAAGNTGTVLKGDVLAKAMRRLNAETERRRSLIANTALVANAQKALEMKQAHEMHAPDFNSRTARNGMNSIPNLRAPNLIRPGERGRLRKANAVSQARRDSHPA